MDKFETLNGVAVPLLRPSIDTDAIIPSREMKRVSKAGLGEGLFAGWRYHYDGNDKLGPDESFVLNRPEYAGASILIGGPNFGCGSSREHAVWALIDFGIRAVVAPSFGAIFKRNCFRNGLLPVELPSDAIEALVAATADDPQSQRLVIDLDERMVRSPDGRHWSFAVPDAVRQRLLEGLDEIDMTLKLADEIRSFRRTHVDIMPWVALADPARDESSRDAEAARPPAVTRRPIQ